MKPHLVLRKKRFFKHKMNMDMAIKRKQSNRGMMDLCLENIEIFIIRGPF